MSIKTNLSFSSDAFELRNMGDYDGHMMWELSTKKEYDFDERQSVGTVIRFSSADIFDLIEMLKLSKNEDDKKYKY